MCTYLRLLWSFVELLMVIKTFYRNLHRVILRPWAVLRVNSAKLRLRRESRMESGDLTRVAHLGETLRQAQGDTLWRF